MNITEMQLNKDAPHKKVKSDQWGELALNYFDPDHIDDGIFDLIETMLPLWSATEGDVGIMLDLSAMRMDLITEWTGQGNQTLPHKTKNFAAWIGRTYEEIRTLLEKLKVSARQKGIELKLGMMIGGGAGPEQGVDQDAVIYDLGSVFCDRHPEVFYLPWHRLYTIDPRKKMHSDTYEYAAYPKGVSEGESFTSFFAAQWKELSQYLGLDAIILRDGCFGHMCYNRNGPFGNTLSSDPVENATWNEAIKQWFRDLRAATPEALLMGYSSALSVTAEMRVGAFDLEDIVADGCMDIWVDQTWGGAWQDFWSYETIGWTFLMASMQTHLAAIVGGNLKRKTPCRFYGLIGIWDAWEPWETMRQVPGKLRWSIWAYQHAAVMTPDKIYTPDGIYIAWLNCRSHGLPTPEEIEFLRSNIVAAAQSANSMEKVYGPVSVYHRDGLLRMNAQRPAENGSEWVEDQVGFMMKYGTPILASTRPEWISPQLEGAICPLVGPEDQELIQKLRELAQKGCPVVLTGRADLLDRELLSHAEAQIDAPENQETGFYAVNVLAKGKGMSAWDKLFLPAHSSVKAEGQCLMTMENGGSLMTAGESLPILYWQPPDLYEPTTPAMRRCQFGGFSSYFLAADWMRNQANKKGLSIVQEGSYAEPVTVHYWRSSGKLFVLLGNLETGPVGDARLARTVRLTFRREHLGIPEGQSLSFRDCDTGEQIAPLSGNEQEWTFELVIAPEGSRVLVCANF